MSRTEEIEALWNLISNSDCYAGIGSRLTPILCFMQEIAAALATRGLILRSGGPPGADVAFEKGCDMARGRKEIFLPWKGFNRSFSPHFSPPKQAEELASYFHPRWNLCTPSMRKLHARNCQQVLGKNLDNPIDFLLFRAPERKGWVEPGSATAVLIARRMNIPTFNLWQEETLSLWLEAIDGL